MTETKGPTVCVNCGEGIHLNSMNDEWYHWDGYRLCLDLVYLATPKKVEE